MAKEGKELLDDDDLFPELYPVQSLVLTAGSSLAEATAGFLNFVKKKEGGKAPTVDFSADVKSADAGAAGSGLILGPPPSRRQRSISRSMKLTMQAEDVIEEEEETEAEAEARAAAAGPPPAQWETEEDTATTSMRPLSLRPLRLSSTDDEQQQSGSSSAATTPSQVMRFKPSLKLSMGAQADAEAEGEEEEAEIQTFEVAASPSHMLQQQRQADAERRRFGGLGLNVDEERSSLQDSFVISSEGVFEAKGIKVTNRGIEGSGRPALDAIADAKDEPETEAQQADRQRKDRLMQGTGSSSSPPSSSSPVTAAAPPAAAPSVPSISLNKHDLVRLGVIGKGQNGQVYKAIHVPTLTRVALKSMNIYEKSTRHQLLHELTAYAALSSPYLVSFLGAYHEAGVITVASEYMDCGSLQSFIKRYGCISEERLLRIVCKQATLGLHYLHQHHRVHRDIKPDNILLNIKGQCRLADFGLLTELQDTHAFTDTFLGTLAYLSPERLKSSQYGYKSDVWSLGLSLLFVVTGSLPVQCADYWQMLDLISKQPPHLDRDKYGEELCSFVDACLKIDEEQRASAAELLQHPFIRDVDVQQTEDFYIRTRQLIENIQYNHVQPSHGTDTAAAVSASAAAEENLYNIGTNDADLDVILDLIIEKAAAALPLSSAAAAAPAQPFSSSSSAGATPAAYTVLHLGMSRLGRGLAQLDARRLSVLGGQFAMSHEEIQHKFAYRQKLWMDKQMQQQPPQLTQQQ